VFENRRIFGHKWEELAEVWRRLHNEELHNMYSATNVGGVIETKVHWMGGACSMHERDENCIYNFGWKSLKGRDHSEDLRVDGRIVLECNLGKEGGRVWTGLIWLRLLTSIGLL
jgi:hypothetical protein